MVAGLASATPPDSRQEKIRVAIGVLRSDRSSQEQKFSAMGVLGNLRAEEAIPDLVHFLDLRREYPWERAGDVIGEMPMITAVSRFPAVSALVAIGEPALPALLEVVAASKPDDLRSVNARLAFETIFRDDLAKGVEAIRGLRGTTVRVTIEGNSFGTSPTVNAGSGITVNYVSRSDTQIVADFAISSSATPGSRTITVSAPGGVASASFYVQLATQVTPVSTQVQGQAACPAGTAGWSRTVTLVLQDQASPPHDITKAGITMADTIQIGTPNGLGISGTVTGSHSTDSNGRWPDTYFVCSTVCVGGTGQTNASQSWTANSTSLPHVNAVVYKCNSITVDGL